MLVQEHHSIVTVQNISVPYKAVADFCRRHGIRELSLFGSLLRDNFTDQNDVDVLVDFLPGISVTFFELRHEIDARTNL
jgi:predicted nucleotidyltransferase